MGDFGFPGLFLAIVVAFCFLLYFLFQIFRLIRLSVPNNDAGAGTSDAEDDEEEEEEEEEEEGAQQLLVKPPSADLTESKKDR